MALVDANIVLRYILRDNKELALNAKVLMEKEVHTFDKKLKKLLQK